MINYVNGILTEVWDNMIIVEAGGIGYGINVPLTVMSELPEKGTEIKVYTYYSVKEDSQSLYGFLYREDRDMFKQLLSVNGVGPKGALAILSVLGPEDLRMAVITGDVKSISNAQGIGKKTAERVILDLKDKIGDLSSFGAAADITSLKAGAASAGGIGPVAEAIDALTMLGYSRAEAGRAVSKVDITEGMQTEEVLKAALKNIRS